MLPPPSFTTNNTSQEKTKKDDQVCVNHCIPPCKLITRRLIFELTDMSLGKTSGGPKKSNAPDSYCWVGWLLLEEE